MSRETYYVVLRDEHNNLVRVPTHTQPGVSYGSHEPTRYTGLLLQCEGLVALANDGSEKRYDLHGSAWLQSATQRDADSAMDYELMLARYPRV